MMRDSGDEEEEWGGAAMDVEDADMMGDDDDDDAGEGDASVIKQEQDGVIRRRRGDTPEAVARRMQRGAGNDDDDELGADDEMLDDLAATADSDAEEGGEDENGSAEVANGSVLLAASLPLQLLALSRPATALSFLPLTAFAETSSSLTAASKGSNGLIGTAAVEGFSAAAAFPAALSTLSEAVTTIHVRAIEALNNLYVTLSRGKKTRRDPKELQEVFETALGLVQGALEAASKASASNDGAAAAEVVSASGKKGKSGGGSGTRKQQEEEVDEVQERRREVVMAGMGVVWGCTILGLDPERNGKLVRCTFLIQA